MSFPKWLYHAKEGAKLIETEEQEKALGAGWEDHPDKLKEDEKKPKGKIKEMDLVAMKVGELRAILTEAGVDAEELKGLQKDDLIAKIGELK